MLFVIDKIFVETRQREEMERKSVGVEVFIYKKKNTQIYVKLKRKYVFKILNNLFYFKKFRFIF